MNGTLINYYFHCKRQLWLSYNKINLELNSEDVLIGKELHNELNKSKNTEIASIMQLKYYLYILNSYNIKKDGKLKIIEKDKTTRDIKIKYDKKVEQEVKDTIIEIDKIINNSTIPTINKDVKKCKKCSYYEFCWI